MYDTPAEIDEFFRCLFHFQPIKELGEGAFGKAYLVFDEVEQLHKVFKLPKDERTTDALRQEGANLVKLSELLHPNIIRLHQYGKVRMTWNDVEQDRFYINMAFGGSTLRSKLGRHRKELDENGNEQIVGSGMRIAPEEAVRIAVDVCSGLVAAHGFRGARVRMIHRDVKPENILIDDNTGVARLGDFGLSRVIARSSSQVSGAGTFLYMDPECFHGRASVTSDLYSLGIVIYEMVTGELPFNDFQQRFDGPPRHPRDIVSDLPSELDDITLRAMSFHSADRYADANAMLIDLRRLAARLNPLPKRFTRVSELPGGRVLCRDEDCDERVAVRLINTSAALQEFAAQCHRLEESHQQAVEIPLRHFANEQFVGIVSRVPADPDLQQQYGNRTFQAIEELVGFCDTAARICDTLAILHRNGLVHGLLSPYSVTVGKNGPVVHDAGASPVLRARKAAGRADQSLESLGAALPFMSPQLLAASHDPTPADDIYAVGAIMYQLLTREPPIGQEDRHRMMLGGSVAEPVYNCRFANLLVPATLDSVIGKALHFSPHDRFDDLAQMAERLRSIQWPDDSVDALVEDALQCYPVGGGPAELIQACDLLKIALLVAPGSPKVHYARGLVYLRDGSFRYAIEEFTKAALVAPNPETLDLLGQAFEGQGENPARAVAAYERALQYRDDSGILERLAKLLWRIDRPKRAIRTLQQSIDCETDESLRQRKMILLHEWKQSVDSAPQTTLATAPPYSADTSATLPTAAMETGQISEPRSACLDKSTASDKEDARQ